MCGVEAMKFVQSLRSFAPPKCADQSLTLLQAPVLTSPTSARSSRVEGCALAIPTGCRTTAGELAVCVARDNPVVRGPRSPHRVGIVSPVQPVLSFITLIRLSQAFSSILSGQCVDKTAECEQHKRAGLCTRYPVWMDMNCKRTCNLCGECSPFGSFH